MINENKSGKWPNFDTWYDSYASCPRCNQTNRMAASNAWYVQQTLLDELQAALDKANKEIERLKFLYADNLDLAKEVVIKDQVIKVLRDALETRRCDEVQNYEGSGMFNKHDPKCRKHKALEAANDLLKGEK